MQDGWGTDVVCVEDGAVMVVERLECGAGMGFGEYIIKFSRWSLVVGKTKMGFASSGRLWIVRAIRGRMTGG